MVAFGIGAYFVVQSLPASITLNGSSIDVGGSKTLSDALHASGIKPKPGDLVAVDGSVLEEGKGEPFHATINGEATTDINAKLASGDVVELGDGSPIEEPSETVEAAIPFTHEEEGRGPIHLIEGQGADGVKRTKTGSMSGIATEEVTQEPVNVVRRNVSPDVGDDKVVALTFDDGPWPETTAAVLDVLAENGAKATFFTVGNRIDGEGVDLVKRAAAEGHQICTHSYDHAAGDGQSVNLGYMKPEDQVAEVQKGYEAIEAATGAEASHVFRTPGGNYGEDVMRNIGPLISAEIGWNIDSQDWRKPGAGAIADQIKNAWPGAIVLMHDGGGDRSQTVEALKDALPYLKSQGYRFITMDELLSYPLS
ncbi:polysaccharide deacetylase family protein [Eggerthella guodeyinii]|uniref:Polysaccharide deacetylase family protein n=2 Tax=Eggerthella TaxID=84111 RepID=A0A7M2A2P0_9ACTN|nr:polysaccharide deacetylase family protein [Eggerthella hominis]QOS70093.1 polysaccharide deacetylase family protein [Eggerthella guodeyinii]